MAMGVLMLTSGCLTGPDWVTKAGQPIDPRDELRCNEYETAMNSGRFTGFNAADKAQCMRAQGYVRPWEVKK
jgi:hypothetical protein